MQFNPSNFDAIIFDLGGVILNLDYNKTVLAFQKLGMGDFEHYYSQAQQHNLFDDFETGSISITEFREYFRKTINPELSDLEIDNAWNAMLLDLPEARITLLNQIQSTIPIYLFSNTNAIHLKAFKEIIGQTFGDKELLEKTFNKVYYSHEVGLRKPNTNAFMAVLDEHKLDPKKVLFIDDSIQHIEGAKNLGIQVHHLKNQDITSIFNTTTI